MKDLVTELLSQGLGLAPRGAKKPAVSAMVGTADNGLPVIRCSSKAAATRMGVRELLKLEQEAQLKEDLLRARIAH